MSTSELVVHSSVLPVAIKPIPADEVCGLRGFEVPEIQVALSGEGIRWLDVQGQCRKVRTRPSMVELYAEGYEIRSTRWLGRAGDCVAIQFPHAQVERLLGVSRPRLQLASQHELFDQRVAHLCRELAEQCRKGWPTEPLYVQGLSVALVALLSSGLQGAVEKTHDGGCLTGVQRKRIEDCIEADLSVPQTIERLSFVVGLSPSQLCKRFKASFGTPVHQYILRRRLDAASRELLAQPARPIVDVALSLGFSSQSHFSEAFRRYTGTSPACFRRETVRTVTETVKPTARVLMHASQA